MCRADDHVRAALLTRRSPDRLSMARGGIPTSMSSTPRGHPGKLTSAPGATRPRAIRLTQPDRVRKRRRARSMLYVMDSGRRRAAGGQLRRRPLLRQCGARAETSLPYPHRRHLQHRVMDHQAAASASSATDGRRRTSGRPTDIASVMFNRSRRGSGATTLYAVHINGGAPRRLTTPAGRFRPELVAAPEMNFIRRIICVRPSP